MMEDLYFVGKIAFFTLIPGYMFYRATRLLVSRIKKGGSNLKAIGNWISHMLEILIGF
jgi:hypothetical protein